MKRRVCTRRKRKQKRCHRCGCYKSNKRRIRIRSRNRNMHFSRRLTRGGQLGTEIVGQGTHGVVEVDPQNANYVFKTYLKLKVNHCEHLANEYKMQKWIRDTLQNPMIYIPDCFEHTEDDVRCGYKMERIFPLPELQKMVLINMNEVDKYAKFAHSLSVIEVGANRLCEIVGCNLDELAYHIGLMFSKMHFVMNVDGYDCELYCGIVKPDEKPKYILIDYDKVNTFQWNIGTVVYRKIDESTVEEKRLSTTNKFGWFLYMAMASMSLVPSQEPLFQQFLKGYAVHATTELQQQVLNEIVDIHHMYHSS